MRLWIDGLALMATMLAVQPALGFEPLDSLMQVSFAYGGQEQRLTLDKVPLLPEGACYSWWIKVPADAGLDELSERLILPAPATDWSGLDTDPDDGIEIMAGGSVAVSALPGVPDAEGWLSNGWCIAPGDPPGLHRIEVSANGVLVERFAFEVVLPEDFPWPALAQPDPSARSVYQSW